MGLGSCPWIPQKAGWGLSGDMSGAFRPKQMGLEGRLSPSPTSFSSLIHETALNTRKVAEGGQTSDLKEEEARDPRTGRHWPGVESEAGPEAGKEEARPRKGSSPVIRPPLPSSPWPAAHTPCELLRGEGSPGRVWGVCLERR